MTCIIATTPSIHTTTTIKVTIYKGTFITFEAKSTNSESLPLANFKVHQRRYINDINEHGGFGFYIIAFKSNNEFFLITQEVIESLDRQSLPISIARTKGYALDLIYPGIFYVFYCK